jgi:hypothetical protein
MPDHPVWLWPIEEADLDLLSRFDTDPAARQPLSAQWLPTKVAMAPARARG